MTEAHVISAQAHPGPTCVRCLLHFDPPESPDGPRVLYCSDCVSYFQDDQRARNRRNHVAQGSVSYHAIPASRVPPGSRPLTSQDPQTKKYYCGLCGSDDVSDEYGASCYGLGTFTHCRACGGVLDFITDNGI